MGIHVFHIEENHVRIEVRHLRREVHSFTTHASRLTGNAHPSAGMPGHITEVSAGEQASRHNDSG